jgi:hypothetical protein
VTFGQPLDEVILGPVRVLVFVDHDEPELLRVLVADVLDLVEELDGLQQQVVKIEGAVVAQTLDVLVVDLCQLFPALAPAL